MSDYFIYKIDILKIDIEGAEKYIFTYSKCEWLKKVNIMIIELHDRIEKGCSYAFFNKLNKIIDNYTLEIKNDNIIIYINEFN